jgi:hypothetical protein
MGKSGEKKGKVIADVVTSNSLVWLAAIITGPFKPLKFPLPRTSILRNILYIIKKTM